MVLVTLSASIVIHLQRAGNRRKRSEQTAFGNSAVCFVFILQLVRRTSVTDNAAVGIAKSCTFFEYLLHHF